jgi:quercetin dioxygenase-like cupin family protein
VGAKAAPPSEGKSVKDMERSKMTRPIGGEGRSTKLFRLAGLFASVSYPLQAQERKEVAVTPLSSSVTSSGQPIVLPQQVTVSIYDVVPGAALPVHKHPYPLYACVLSGNSRVTNTETGRRNTSKAEDFIVEAVGQWHMGATKHVWSIRTRLQLESRTRDLVMFNLAIDASRAAATLLPPRLRTLLRTATPWVVPPCGKERPVARFASS